MLYIFICALDLLSNAFRLLGGKTAGKLCYSLHVFVFLMHCFPVVNLKKAAVNSKLHDLLPDTFFCILPDAYYKVRITVKHMNEIFIHIAKYICHTALTVYIFIVSIKVNSNELPTLFFQDNVNCTKSFIFFNCS